MKRLFQLSFIFLSNLVFSQSIVTSINWQNAGHKTPIQEHKEVNFLDYHRANLSFISDRVMDSIIAQNPEGVVVYIPEGDYIFYDQIELPSNFILRGDGVGKTRLTFELRTSRDLIYTHGRHSWQQTNLKSSAMKGDSIIIVDNNGLQVGDWIQLADTDDELVKSNWARRKTGQFIRIKGIDGDLIYLSSQLRRNYLIENSPSIQKKELVENVGIEDLSIDNRTVSSIQTSNIQFQYAHNCWVKNVSSKNCNYAHVLFEYATHCSVINSEFEGAHDYGNGGKAYGVVMQFATGDCLVMGSKFSNLRHSLLLQAGANGNVLVTNVSSNPHWEGVFLPDNSSGDIVLHGNYVYANLIAKNDCQTIVIDNSHGFNGPDNLFFENLVSGYGIIMNRKSSSGGQLFIDNTIVNDKIFKGRFRIKGKDHYLQGNMVKGKINPKKSDKSNFKISDFFDMNQDW